MQTLESLGRHIQSVQDLQSVVKTMKGLAAVNIRQYEEAVDALRDYNRSLELGMQIVLQQAPSTRGFAPSRSDQPVAIVLLGSDQGMCGPFNARIVAHAAARLDETEAGSDQAAALVVGMRAAAEWEASGARPSASLNVPGSVAEITRRVEEVLLRIDRWREERRVGRVWLFHQRPLDGASYEPHFQQVVPLDEPWLDSLRARPWPTRMLPTFTMDAQTLFSAITRQYLFTTFYRALAESLASENAARLAAMQAAEKNVEERLDELTAQYHRRRQNTITEELLDVIAGFELLGQGN
jgi:F-type H+-transporting ATPase subunit gamma